MTKKKQYIQMFSIHGLIRAENLELGRDADTGGQTLYLVELCRELSKRADVAKIDLFTRYISDKAVSEDYARKTETVNEKFNIIRIQCGGKKYHRKELLWPYLDEFVDKTLKFIKRHKQIPDIVHGHYADAGYVAMHLARIFGIPFIFTGHSLGKNKKQKLLEDGWREEEVNRRFKIDHRIAVEEEIVKNADMVITSTHQEIEKQYGLYRENPSVEFRVIPPGFNIEKFYPFYHDMLPDNEKSEMLRYAKASVVQELNRFFMHPDRPVILALCRPDKRKNISGLIKAYGEDSALQAMANLAVFAGIRKDIAVMEQNEQDVLTEMLLLMDKYDLYGKMAIPKKHDFELEVPELYRFAAGNRGVFVNAALTEPFGLTLLESAATGLPIVATNDGGPNDIVHNCRNGILVDPSNPGEIAEAIKKIITENGLWDQYSKNGIMRVRKYYTWETHSKAYLKEVNAMLKTMDTAKMEAAVPTDAIGRRLVQLNHLLFANIDDTLVGKDNSHLPELISLIEENRDHIGFGVVTGRSLKATQRILKNHNIPMPDIIMASVGTELYYGKAHHYGQGWETHIAHQWDREKILALLRPLDFLKYQTDSRQGRFKISFDIRPGKDRLAQIHDILLKHKCRYNLIYSHDRYIDILPYRASKGKAIRYLSYKWEIPLSNFLVCGDSGNDEEMLRGEPKAVVVGNYSPELAHLKGARMVYFAEQPSAGGILQGIAHYRFIEKAKGNTYAHPE